ncbi:MAG: LysM peptidoglycan-binding domain-containing protein [Vicingaceae bacterium]
MIKANKILKGFIVMVAFLAVVTSFAQSDSLQVDSLEVHSINGKEYYIHIVEKGESLYAIHKKYNAPIEIIKKENPSVLDGLSIGEKVFIPVKKSVEYEVKTDGNFIVHTVKKKQTLYAIAKLYDVNQKAIVTANPELVDGLKEGQDIKIPVKGIKKEDPPKVIENNQKYKTHTVAKGETLYALSKLYDVTIKSIKNVNGGLSQGLILGEKIYIPIEVTRIKIDSVSGLKNANLPQDPVIHMFDSLFVDSGIVKKGEYAIGLFLPFYLDVNDEMVESRSALAKKTIYPKSKFALEFYNGVKYALDSISTDSCKFKLFVYDTNGNDSLRIKSLLLKPELKNLDLIIGPLYFDNFKKVSNFAKANQIPIITPVKQSNKLLLGNQFIFKAIPSKSTTITAMSELVVDSFKTENLLAIAYEGSKEKLLVNEYVQAYNNKILASEDTTIYSAIKVLKITTDINSIVASLHPAKNNVIYVPTTDQTFVTKLFSLLTTTLNKKQFKDYRITLLGLEEWMSFENIDLPYFQKLNVHYCSTRFINTEDSLVQNFTKDYFDINKVFPSDNTFLGFDLVYFLGNNLIQNGTMYAPNSLVDFKGMSINLNFFKTGVESGFENTESFLLRFDDFTLKRVR